MWCKIVEIIDNIFRLPFICCGPSTDELGKESNLGSSPNSEECLISSDKLPSHSLRKNSILSNVSETHTYKIESAEESMIPRSVGLLLFKRSTVS